MMWRQLDSLQNACAEARSDAREKIQFLSRLSMIILVEVEENAIKSYT
jgi:hypothetical protein